MALSRGTNGEHVNPAAVGTLTSRTQNDPAKLSDTMINGFSDKTLYRGICGTLPSIFFNAAAAFVSNDQWGGGGLQAKRNLTDSWDEQDFGWYDPGPTTRL